MTVPGRRDAARLLRSLEPPEWFLRHTCAVADVAAWLAARAAARGLAVDRQLVATAALLHDVDKLPTAAVPARLRHGEGSAAWLAARGWVELGPVVREHPVTRLAELEYETWAASASLEARIVAYADKRAGQRLEAMDARFASWRRRYPDGPGDHVAVLRTPRTGWGGEVAALVLGRALDLERDVCAAAGVAPKDVRRLRWARRALRNAA
jgi:putative nucleotidyltransferase with HDIG domain